jgi:Zn finger protein HypA/HybF involved in hydrogenase expression
MHETILAKEIIKKAQEFGKVKEITVEVGELAHLPLEDMKHTMSEMVKWKLNFVLKPATVVCKCGFKGRPKVIEHSHDFTLFQCPDCEAELPKIVDGEDIILKDVEVE